MAYGCVPGQAFYDGFRVEMIPNKALTALCVKLAAIEAHNSGRFLAAVLKRMKADGRDGCRIGVIENAENPAFLVQPILRGVDEP
jgi:hypothetical protein